MEDQTTNQEPTELEKLQKQSDEYLNNWKRAAADMANYKKEELERTAMLVKYSKESVIDNVLPILDSIDLAAKHIPEHIKNDSWMQGFMHLQKQVADFLRQEGIEPIEATGQPFDPTTMEIVAEVENGESGTVAEELQKGYKLGEKVLRPAKVKITK